MEKIPPVPPTHEPQPQVYVAPAPQQFASQTVTDDELLDESTLPVSYPIDGDDYFNAEEEGELEEVQDMESYEQDTESYEQDTESYE